MENLSPNPNKTIPPKYQLNETKLHRFVPTEKPRAVVEHPVSASTKIAGRVGFDPVATVTFPDKTVFVRPVKNTHTRAVSPGVVNTSGKLNVTGKRTIEISDNLHSQIKAKVTSTMKALIPPKSKTEPVTPVQYVTSANMQNLAKPLPPTQSTENQVQTQTRNETLKNQLGHLNNTLFEQIKKKISSEISTQSSVQKTTQPLGASVVTPTPANLVTKTLGESNPSQNPAAVAQTQAGPVSQPTREHLRSLIETKPTEAKPEQREIKLPLPSFETAPSKHREIPTITPSVNVPVQKKESTSVTPSLVDYKQHITQLEEELNLLNKEVNYMDRTMADLEKERDVQELSSLERKIDVDRQMLLAVADWRSALNNLINSHTVALKYLKQKTDWLESQVERLSGHRDKHAQEHHKPRPIEIIMSSLPPIATKPAEIKITNIELSKEAPASNPEIVVGNTIKFTSTEQENPYGLTQKPDTGSQSSTKPDNNQVELQANLITKEITPNEAASFAGPTVVKEVQTTSFEAVKNMVQEALRKEQPNIKPSDEALRTLVAKTLEYKELVGKADPLDIRKAVDSTIKARNDLVSEAVRKEIPNIKPTQESVREVLDQTLKTDPSLVKPSVEEIKSIVKEEIAKSPPRAVNITISQTDIEKQILDQAAKEDAEKETRNEAKREELRNKAEEAALKKLGEVQTGQAKTTSSTIAQIDTTGAAVSEEVLQKSFTKLKTNLTTIDSKALGDLSADKRTEMLQKLQDLEQETEVTRQYDELKAAAERRRINNQLQDLLTAAGAKPIAKVTQPEPTTPPIPQKIERLKIEQSHQQTPEEKARLIAEIKDLERRSQDKIATEAVRPVVKSQPAYGKMLPNTPTVPNVINGIVKDSRGLLLPTVIIIVKDLNGDPVRALKTNKIGQFALSTAVPNGTYTLDLEKEGYDFDIIEVDVNGTIMQPIEIKSK